MALRLQSRTAPPRSSSPAGVCAMPKWWRRPTAWASPWSSPASATSDTSGTDGAPFVVCQPAALLWVRDTKVDTDAIHQQNSLNLSVCPTPGRRHRCGAALVSCGRLVIGQLPRLHGRAAVDNRRARSCDIVSYLINSLKTKSRSFRPGVLTGTCACGQIG